MREAGAARNLVPGLELSILFPIMKFNPIKRVQLGKLRYKRAPEKGAITRGRISTHTTLWNLTFVACNAENYVLSNTYWRFRPIQVSLSTP
jgi:hypothetical protein